MVLVVVTVEVFEDVETVLGDVAIGVVDISFLILVVDVIVTFVVAMVVKTVLFALFCVVDLFPLYPIVLVSTD